MTKYANSLIAQGFPEGRGYSRTCAEHEFGHDRQSLETVPLITRSFFGISSCLSLLTSTRVVWRTEAFQMTLGLWARVGLTWLILAVGATNAFAACHVVLSGGTGKANGSDWNNALSDVPSTLHRGDIYFLAAGTYGRHLFSDPDSGTVQIEIRSTTASDHCTNLGWKSNYVGPAVFRAQAKNAGYILAFTTDYYVINGMYRSTATQQPYTDWKSGYGIKVDNSNQFACGSDIGGGSPGGPTFVHDITLEYIEVSGSHDDTSSCTDDEVAFAGGSYNLSFLNMYVHNAGNNNFVLAGNHGHPGGGAGYGPGTNNKIAESFIAYDCCIKGAHGQACQCSEGLQNLTIAHNIFANMVSTGFIATASATGYKTGNGPNGPWYIYGNLFMADDPRHCAVGDGVLAIWDSTFTDAVYFLNNTIANLGTRFCSGQLNTGFGLGLGANTRVPKLYVQNNLWWNSDVLTAIPSGTSSWNGATFDSVVWSHNAYFQGANASKLNDRDKQRQMSAADPFRNSGQYDLRLARHTDAGIDTHSMVAGNDFDLNGNRRGQNGVWDRGAVQVQDQAVNSKGKDDVTHQGGQR